MSDVIRFTDPASDQRELVGGKGANLGRLVQAGFRVPPGFAVTTAAYRNFMASTGLGDEIARIVAQFDYANAATVEVDTARIRELIISRTLPDGLAAEIRQAYHEVGGDTDLEAIRSSVAVRSSGTAEDLAEASFAGMHDTYLDVSGVDAVLDAVRRCWASLWTARATSYRHDRGFGRDDISICVVVQQMVNSEVAGVMFTANPLSGAVNELVINANWGLGESVVSGIVSPDEYVISRDDLRVKERTLGSKVVRVVRNPDGQGTIHEDVPAAEQATFTLSDDQVAQLAELGLQVSAHYEGFPQDIEWALFDGVFYLLQSRDVTGVEISWDEDLDNWQYQREADDTIYTRAWSDDYWNGAITPLHYSWRAKEMSDLNFHCQKLWGFEELADVQTWKYHKGEAYFSCNMQKQHLAHILPGFLKTPSTMNNIPPRWWDDLKQEPFSWTKLVRLHARINGLSPRIGALKVFDVWRKRLADESEIEMANGLSYEELRRLSDTALEKYLNERIEIFYRVDYDTWTCFFVYAPFIFTLLQDLLERWYDKDDAMWAFADLCAGLPQQTVTLVENQELLAFANEIRTSKTLSEILDGFEGAAFFDELSNHEEGRSFLARYQPWCDTHGHRGAADRDCWYERRGDTPMIDYNVFKSLVAAEPADPLLLEQELIVLRRGAVRLGERVRGRFDHLGHGLLRDTAVAKLDLDHRHDGASFGSADPAAD